MIYTAIEPIIFTRVFTQKIPPVIASILLFLVLSWLGYEFFKKFLRDNTHHRISVGEKILSPQTNPSKQAGVQAFSQGDFATAIVHFQTSLQSQPNDPETRIYWHNAKAATKTPLKIAVSVPIGENLNVAQEMLRGVAQAQEKVNTKGGINGALLQVAIANDNNNPKWAEKIAKTFVKDGSILAVVGHNSSDASLAASSVYQPQGLVMISPTSDAKELSSVGNFIFRTIPGLWFQSDLLRRYALKVANLQKIVICVDSKAAYSLSLQQEFTLAFSTTGGRILAIDCDFSDPNFNPEIIVSESGKMGAQALLLIPFVDRLSLAMDLARANRGKLALLGSSTLYTFQTLEQGKEAVQGMVLAVAWHPNSNIKTEFVNQALELWGGPVNWRTAMAYDATLAIAEGLKESTTRAGLQAVLSSWGFSVEGASGEVQFLPSGDRNGSSILIQIQPVNSSTSGTGYDFVPIFPNL